MKGASGKFRTDKVLEFIEENGDREREVILKTDQEAAAEYLKKDILEERGEAKTIPEASPVTSSSSNGLVERAVQEV